MEKKKKSKIDKNPTKNKPKDNTINKKKIFFSKILIFSNKLFFELKSLNI